MLNKNDNNKLDIFENFQTDRSLPKNKISKSSSIMLTGVGDVSVEGGVSNFIVRGQNEGFLIKLMNRLYEKIKIIRENCIKKISVQEFFTHIKNTEEEIAIINNKVENYLKAINNANKFGQTALVEKLTSEIAITKTESQLLSLGLTKIISEQQIVNFYKDCVKGLKLTWIKNYARMVPQNLLDIKLKCDELEIFDNYVILHYDPLGKTYAMTKKEIEDKKDPILFGVINGSRKLYYIGDWVDECCDLTIQEFIDKFGEDSIEKITGEIKIKCN